MPSRQESPPNVEKQSPTCSKQMGECIINQVWRSSSQPNLGVEFLGFPSELELQDVVLSYCSEDLPGAHMLTLSHHDVLEVAIHGDEISMAHHHHQLSRHAGNGSDLSVEDGTCAGTRLALDVDAFVVEGYIAQVNENELKELTRIANNVANNINQIARRANVTNKVYKEDIEEVESLAGQIIDPLLFLQTKVLQLKR